MRFFAVVALASVAIAAPVARPAPQGSEVLGGLKDVGTGLYNIGAGVLSPVSDIATGIFKPFANLAGDILKPAVGLVGSVTKPATSLIGKGFSGIGDLFETAAAKTPTIA